MPTLNWIGKDKVITHHQDVPYQILKHTYGFDAQKGKTKQPTDSGNMIIQGDNLAALKSLLPKYEGKVKCIYIDPPYNTGNEGWVYNDNVNDPKIKKWLGEIVGKEGKDLSRHDKWLCMMYPRLKLLHKLLREDGVIFVSIDDDEQATLKMAMDEIFGTGCFIGNIIWQKKYSPQNDARFFSDMHDFVVCYAKNSSKELGWQRRLLPRTEEQNRRYKNPDNDPRGPWKSSDLSVKTYNKNTDYPIVTPSGRVTNPPAGYCWRISEDKLKEMKKDNRIWFGVDGNNVPSIKRFLSEVQDGIVPGTLFFRDECGDNQEAKQILKQIFSESSTPFDTPKPPRLIERLLTISCDKGDIILDSFAGSGTTTHAVMNLNKQDGGNRKFILVEMEEYAESITAERVKRVAQGYGEGGKAVEGLGGAFDYYELGPTLLDSEGNLSNEATTDEIREYMCHSETGMSLPDDPEVDHLYFLARTFDRDHYFYYEPDRATTLDRAFLASITEQVSMYTIWADICEVPNTTLDKWNITFRKIPRDIRKI